MGELVLLIVALCKRNEDAQIMFSRSNLDAGSRELGRKLVEAARSNAFFGAVNEECRDGWMMRRLFGEI